MWADPSTWHEAMRERESQRARDDDEDLERGSEPGQAQIGAWRYGTQKSSFSLGEILGG